MRKMLFILMLFFYNLSFSQWQRVSLNLPYGLYYSQCIDAVENFALIYVVHNRTLPPDTLKLFKTSDNGKTWGDVFYKESWGAPCDISIIDSLNYWVASQTGYIVHTTDGGKNWEVQFCDSSLTTFMNYIEMFDLNNGVAMGDAPNYTVPSDTNKACFLRTTNGGKHWQVMENNQKVFLSSAEWLMVDFVSPEFGFFYENSNLAFIRGILKTIDGGNNWEVVSEDAGHGTSVIKFYDENIGAQVNYKNPANFIIRTTNGGKDWTDTSFALSKIGYDIEFIKGNPALIWATDYDYMYFSNDTGKTWTKQVLVSNGVSARDIDFVNDHEGWVLCDKYIYYTNNLGGFLTDVDEGKQDNLPKGFILSQNYPNPFGRAIQSDNQTTTIKYSIPNTVITRSQLSAKQSKLGIASTTSSSRNDVMNVKLKVYDILGREVATLVNENQPSGIYEVKFDGSKLPSGIYFYRLESGSFSETRKLMLIK